MSKFANLKKEGVPAQFFNIQIFKKGQIFN